MRLRRMLVSSAWIVFGVWVWTGNGGAVVPLQSSSPSGIAAVPDPVTWSDDVAPILMEHCINCHRPGQVAPMSLVSYDEVRPWAPMIQIVVEDRIMPPWHADPEHSADFGNDRRLTDEEIRTISDWVNAGAPRGDEAFVIPDVPVGSGWLLAAELGEPDFIWEFDEPFEVPPSGSDVYIDVIVPTTHQQDIWVQAAEVRGNSRVVHHSGVQVIRPDGSRDPTGRLAAYTPGKQYDRFPVGSGKLIPVGSELRFGMHYNPAGEVQTDRHAVAVWLARDPILYTIHSRAVADPGIDIPPFDPNYESRAEFVFPTDAEITLMKPHMHWRGKDMLYRVVYPDGTIENLLFIPRYDMNWQISYELATPKPVPEGARLEVIAHFDNSPNNPWNPDPSLRVVWGQDSRDEMMEGWFDYRVRMEEPVVPGSAGAQDTPDPTGTWNLQMRSLSDRPTRGVRPVLLRIHGEGETRRAEITSLRNEFVPVQDFEYGEDGRVFARYGVFEYSLRIEGDEVTGTVATPAGTEAVSGRRQSADNLLYADRVEEFRTERSGVIGHNTLFAPPAGTEDPGEWVRSRIESVDDLALLVRERVAIPFLNAGEFEDRLLELAGREVLITGVWVGESIRIEEIRVEGEAPGVP